jgi:hypothetical protein
MLAAAALLAALAFAEGMTSTTLLGLTFALGIGAALNAPAWQAVTSEVVPASELTRAVSLNALTVNIGRAIGPAVGVVLGLAAIHRWPVRAISTRELAPSAHWPEPHLDVIPGADDGPVLVEVEYRIDPLQAASFVQAIRALEPIRLRDGATLWAVYHELSQPGRYLETFVVDSWLEHLRQHDRVTVADRIVEERVQRFHRAETPPAVSHLIAANPRKP